jgi:hypothetical protein
MGRINLTSVTRRRWKGYLGIRTLGKLLYDTYWNHIGPRSTAATRFQPPSLDELGSSFVLLVTKSGLVISPYQNRSF